MQDQELAKEALAELPEDVAKSPLFNVDLAPVPAKRRNWSTYNFAALWISMAHCIPTYTLAGGLVSAEVGMNWWQALLTIGIANLIILVPILLNAHPGTKYGVSFPVLARASFGTKGAQVPAVLRAIVACGWFGINVYFGGEAVKTFAAAVWPGIATLGGDTKILGLSVPSAIAFMIFWILNIIVILRGMNAVRIFENWAAPIVLVMALVLLIWIVGKAGGLGPMLSTPSKFATFGEFWTAFVPSVTANIGFWSTLALNIPDFTRYGKGQKEQMVGQALGLPTTMIAFSAMAVIITSASQAIFAGASPEQLKALWNPEYLLGQITSPVPPPGHQDPLIVSNATRILVAITSLLGIAVATISVNIAANVVSPANDFANLSPRHISFKMGAVITGVVGIIMMPWKLLATAGDYLFAWLNGYSSLLGPIAGIMIADYWLVRRKNLDTADLFRENGRYRGTNVIALVAFIIGVIPNLPGFLKAAGITHGEKNFFDTLYGYAWFIGFFLAGGLYVAGMKLLSPELREKLGARD